jgi:hypothetical protein
MPRRPLAPRLYFDETRNQYVVRHKKLFKRTPYQLGQLTQAQAFLRRIVGQKSNERIDFWKLKDNGIIYFVAYDGGPVKIGFCLKNVENRLRGLQTGNHLKLEILAQCTGSIDMEHQVQKLLSQYRIRNEWFERADQVLEAVSKAREGLLHDWLTEQGVEPKRKRKRIPKHYARSHTSAALS